MGFFSLLSPILTASPICFSLLQKSVRERGRRTPLSLVQALLPANQEMMGQNDQRHVMVPASPKTQLIVVHAQLSLTLGKTGLDRPAHSTHTHKRGNRRLHGAVAATKTTILAP